MRSRSCFLIVHFIVRRHPERARRKATSRVQWNKNRRKQDEKEKKNRKSTSPAVVMLANIRRETRMAALFPHEFLTLPLSPASYPRGRAHVRAHVTTYMLTCIRYVYIRAWRKRREDSIPLGNYTRKKNGRQRKSEREREE